MVGALRLQAGAIERRRAGQRRVPVHRAGVPGAGDRLGARRAAAQRRRLGAASSTCSPPPARWRTARRAGRRRRRAGGAALRRRRLRLRDEDGEPGRRAARRHVQRAGRAHRRAGRPDRLRQVDDRRRSPPAWSTRHAGTVALDGVDAARADRRRAGRDRRAGAAGAVRLRRHRARPTSRSTATASTTTRVWAALRLAQADGFVAAAARRPGHRRSASAAPRCPAASASGSRWPGRWPGGPGCWCSTTRPAPSTRGWRRRSWPRCAAATQATSILVVAYRRATIALADEVVYLEHGRVVARGTHTELLATVPGLRRPGHRLRAGRGRARAREGVRRRGGAVMTAAVARRAIASPSRPGARCGAGWRSRRSCAPASPARSRSRWSRWPGGPPCRSPCSRASTAGCAVAGGPDLGVVGRRSSRSPWPCSPSPRSAAT